MTGTSTVEKQIPKINQSWGNNCINFLDQLYNHESKASKTYYYKSHIQYFEAMYKSLREICRVTKPGADILLVVQNSYYKEIRNDIAQTLIEMGEGLNLELRNVYEFINKRSMADLNIKSKKYTNSRNDFESVIHLKNQALR